MLLWDSWERLPKTILGGQVYAKIGDWNYSRHAINRMKPRTYGINHAEIKEAIKERIRKIDRKEIPEKSMQNIHDPGRGIPPSAVEDVLKHGKRVRPKKQNGNVMFTDNGLEVIVDEKKKVVVTVKKNYGLPEYSGK